MIKVFIKLVYVNDKTQEKALHRKSAGIACEANFHESSNSESRILFYRLHGAVRAALGNFRFATATKF